MRVAVIGLGGVGGYLAANLAKTKNEIVGFARGAHLAKIQSDGIQIIEDEKSWSAKFEAKEPREAEGIFDCVLFCVKSYDLEDAYIKIAPFINASTILLSFSNGVSNGEFLRKMSNAIVLDACVYILSHQESAGIIRKKGKVFFAVFGGDAKATQRVKELFDAAELRNKTPQDIKKEIWKKYIFISAFATLTTYYDKSIYSVWAEQKEETERLLREIASVAKAEGINIFDEIAKAMEIASTLPHDASTSMHLDFTNKKRNELKTLSEYIVEEGEKRGLETPLMKQMYEALLRRDKA